MKTLVGILVVAILLTPLSVSARSGGGGVHFKNNPPYDCSVTRKPSTPKWVVKTKKDKIGDGVVVLTWDDSDRAHDVEIKYGYNGKMKSMKTGDDSREKIKNLKKGKLYTFKIQGYSNCGKSGWSKEYKTLP